MTLARIVCGNCGYTKEIPESALPQQRVNVTCPKCQHVFVFDPAKATRPEIPVNAGSQQSLPKRGLQPDEKLRMKVAAIVVAFIIVLAVVLSIVAPPPITNPNTDHASQLSVNNSATPPSASNSYPPELFKEDKKINPEAVKFYFFVIVPPIVFAALLLLIIFYKRVPSPVFIYDFIEKITFPFLKVRSQKIQNLVADDNIQNALNGIGQSKSNIVTTVGAKNELISELKRISANKSKFSSLTLLIVTIIAFFSTRIITGAWQEVLILIGVILFHELGHLLAMKALRYNDVKMFFIPFIGAAVSGKSKNDTAVKSCIVSLMGPFPGIVLGVFLYILSLLTNNYYVFKTAQMMLLLNAFNFLPIMPLDGGRYIDVLFINRRYFRILFTLIGAGFFLLLAISAKDKIIGFIGAITIFVAISNFKLHGISDELKLKGISATSVNDLIGDESSLQIVIDKLQTSYPRLFKPKMIYSAIFTKLTIIVDTIKFVPAKLLSISTLLVAYLILLSVSLIVSFGLLAANLKDIPRTEENNGKKYVYAERYLLGKKVAEHQLDDALCYDGKGTFFEPDGSISGVNYYDKGYRVGEWLTFDKTGKTIEKKSYDRGQFISLSKLENGTWRTCSIEDLSFYERCIEEIKRLSQPYKSNHQYFEQDKRG